jgi:hypothetical protein
MGFTNLLRRQKNESFTCGTEPFLQCVPYLPNLQQSEPELLNLHAGKLGVVQSFPQSQTNQYAAI